MAKSFKKNNPLDNLNEMPKQQEELIQSQQILAGSIKNSEPERKKEKKKYLRLDITDYQDYISLMSAYSSKVNDKYVSMTQYILHLIELDKQTNREIYDKLEEIERMKRKLI